MCAQLCLLLWRSEVNINVFLYLFFTLCLKDRLPTEHGAYNFSYNGWPASPRHLPVCLPGDGITYGHSAPLCTLNHLPSLLMLSFKLRLDTLTLVRLAAFQLWAVWPTLRWCLIQQSVWQAGTDSLSWRKHSSQTVCVWALSPLHIIWVIFSERIHLFWPQ